LVKVVLYNPRSNASGKAVLPFSLLALGAVLEGVHPWELVDGNREKDPLDRLRALLAAGTEVLGVTAMPGPQLALAIEHSRRLKREFPRLVCVWGGYFPTEHAHVCAAAPYVDYVVRGHGEEVLLRLLAALDRGEGPSGSLAAGLAWRGAAGRVQLGPVARLPHPDALPPFPFHRIDVPSYVRPTFLGARTLGYHSSYGCPFSCNFCGVVSLAAGRWLAQSAVRVAEAVREYAERWRVDAVEFYDNNFFTHEARAREVAERIRPLGLAWWGEGRVDTLLGYSEATWRALRASGLRMVFLGAESGTAEALRRMDKGGSLTPEMTLALAVRMRSHGIVPELSFMVGNPPDPETDTRRTLEFIRRVKTSHPEAEIVLYHYTPVPVPGALLAEAEAAGFAFPSTLEEWAGERWQEVSLRRSARLPWLGRGLRGAVRDFQRVLNAYYPTATDPRLTGWKRTLLRAASAWRYHARVYGGAVELAFLQRVLRYQRPETSGF
jgi:pyruvate-formate lyase-activating enzyme